MDVFSPTLSWRFDLEKVAFLPCRDLQGIYFLRLQWRETRIPRSQDHTLHGLSNSFADQLGLSYFLLLQVFLRVAEHEGTLEFLQIECLQAFVEGRMVQNGLNGELEVAIRVRFQKHQECILDQVDAHCLNQAIVAELLETTLDALT